MQRATLQAATATQAEREPSPTRTNTSRHRPPPAPGIGNQALLRRLYRTVPHLQPKLQIGAVNDPLEAEADRIADQVMRAPDPAISPSAAQPHISRKCAACEEEDKTLHAKPNGKAAQAREAPAIVHDVLSSPGQSLGPAARSFFERRFGTDLSAVRLHHTGQAGNAAKSIGALAFTVGRDIVFADGTFKPDTTRGRRLLAHELTHVLQQSNVGRSFVQRSVTDCVDQTANPANLALIAGGGTAVHQLIHADFMRTAGAIDVMIPGASAAPLRTDGLCGAPSTVIPPQVAGGKAGGGFPDLAMKTTGGILLIAEIKPAVLPCLIDGENQALGYINAGNASDPPQIAWRTGLSVSVVAPMLEKHYPAKSFSVGSAQVKTTWCTPGLLGYSVQNRSNADPVPVPVPNPEKAPVSEEQKKTLRERLPTVPEWVWETIGVTAAAAVIACFALGPCDAAAILAAAGEGVGWIIIQAMRLAGIAVGTMATTAEAGGTPMSVSGSASAAV